MKHKCDDSCTSIGEVILENPAANAMELCRLTGVKSYSTLQRFMRAHRIALGWNQYTKAQWLAMYPPEAPSEPRV